MIAIDIAKLRIKLFFYSPKNIITFFIFPLILIYIVGYIYSPKTINQVPVAVVDEDMSEYSQVLISLIKENEIIHINETTEKYARELVKNNKIEGAYLIKEGFQDNIKKDNYPEITVLKSSAAIGADSISEIISSGVVRLLSNSRAANIVVSEYEKGGYVTTLEKEKLWQEVFEASESYWYPEQLMKLEHKRVDSVSNLNDTASNNGILQLSTGPIGIIVMFLALSLGYVFSMLNREKREGTLQRLFLISGKKDILLGNLYSIVFLLLVQGYFLITVCEKLLGLSFGISGGTLFLIILIYCIYIASIILAISVGASSNSYLNNYYTLIVLITSMIGGSFWSIEVLSAPLQKIARLTPQGLILHVYNLARLQEVFQLIIYILGMIGISIILILYSGKKLTSIISENS